MADEKDTNLPPNDEQSPEGTPPEAADSQGSEPIEPQANAGESQDAPATPETAVEENAADGEERVANEGDASEDDAEAEMLRMLEDLPAEENQTSPDDIQFDNSQVSKAEFQQLSEPAGQGEARNIDMLLDVNLPVAIELGRTKMSISDILALGPGSVVELNKLAGEPVDLLVNQKIVARGEVVVIDENFGVRITHLITPQERLQSLRDE